MKAPAVFFVELMAKARRELYRGKPDKLWFSQQKMVKKALLYPARYLKKFNVPLTAEKYQTIVEGIIDGVVRHGHLDEVTYMGRYFYTCVQKHMEKHGDNYYRDGKAIGNRVSVFMNALEKARRDPVDVIDTLAQVDALLQLGKRKPKAGKTAPAQAEGPVAPRKVRTDALASKLTPEQKEEIARRLASGTGYRQIIALCATWGVKTSLGSLSEYLKPKAAIASAPQEELF